jgi:hypothetical protein
MNENLVPERIVNKNGVHTTVYRKPGGAASKKAHLFPPLALVPRLDMSEENILEALSMKIRAACREQYGGVNDVDQPTIIRTLKQYTPATLKRLYDFLDSPELGRAGSDASVTAHAVANGESEIFISDSINFRPVQGKSTLIRSLRFYPQFPLPVDAIDPDSETFRKATVLMNMTDFIRQTYESNYSPDQGEPPYDVHMVSGSPNFVVLNDERVVNLILEHPEKELRIREIIADHHGTDYEVIAAALASGSALGNGTL